MTKQRRYGEIRVLSGVLRGRRLRYPADRGVRPTMQRTKSSVFESLGTRLKSAVFVDLYAGAGGVGIEALSRGATRVYFVERDAKALAFLRENLVACSVQEACYEVYAGDVGRFIQSGALAEARPDIVYADPPYDVDATVLLALLGEIEYAPETLLVVEHRRDAAVVPPTLALRRRRNYGQTVVDFLVPAER